MVNWDNAERVLDAIDANPDQFDMTAWCGTTRCIAGWAAHLDGWKMPRIVSSVWAEKDNRSDRIPEIAARFLGIDYNDAMPQLFDATAFWSNAPSTAEIRARLKELDK